MPEGLKPIRRVVTGNDERGRSRVVWDGPAPNMHEVSMGPARGHSGFWVWHETPPTPSGSNDDGFLPYDFPGPRKGGHWRVVQGNGRPKDYDPAQDAAIVAAHAPKKSDVGPRWDRG